ncbi:MULTISPECIES: DUF1206 domain-containing protein [unclassified Rhodococcus (in: high G+C Gram-positive bacteria)]|uniref:DUF1206 domain-containing protein n=1 Tax=unclassified Rhodococcus (in: high G+C Gram-positive bacteria) TaxID=192944 RepID=UPI000B3C4FC3|nr:MULTISPECIES: DUF1206 domain-containing protein [unclassified Rhodococcus (in: high G+C Gram-positive bacteria)]KAF0964004.1 hypothetical protein MLGJGCBP_02825 [Rhodococcus sp. T7]OUS89435.1 hypothetical protein CA951_36470 [Rhodococcus sp. NCIMB 12038]
MAQHETNKAGGMSRAVDKATDSTTFERVARAGHVMSGFVHLLIAYIIVQLAFGSGGNADQSGALGTLASKPGGRFALWVATVAFIAMALWRLAETVLGPHATEKSGDSDDTSLLDRAKAFGLAVVYFAFAFSSYQFASGGGKSSGQQNAGMSARLMESGAGKTLLVVVGLVAIAIGGYHIYKGAAKNFLDDLKGTPSKFVEPLGVVGYVAKGLVIAGAGVLVIVAVFNSDPSKATGIDGAVKTLGSAPFGQFLLVLAALGIAAYGLYSFVMARYARM